MDNYRSLFIIVMISMGVLAVVGIVYSLFFKDTLLNLLSDELLLVLIYILYF